MSSPDFNAKRYLDENPDVAAAVARGEIPTAWDHFRQFGQKEGRDGFDWSGSPIQADLTSTPDLKSLLTSGGTVATGQSDGMMATAASGFNAQRYLDENPDVAAAVSRGETTAEQHWITSGRKEGRKGGFTVDAPTAFDDKAYLAANPDIAAAASRGDTTAQEHYLRFGQAEGRKAFYVGSDAKSPSQPSRSAQLSDFIDRYAGMTDPQGLKAGGLAEQLAQKVVLPWRDSLRKVRDGAMSEGDYNTAFDQVVKVRDGILSAADPNDFSEAIRYAGTTTPGFLEAVAKAGASAIERRTAAGTSTASTLSAADQATKDLQAAAEQAANRERVRSRRGRGALMLTGLTGLTDGGTGSVARRLLMGA